MKLLYYKIKLLSLILFSITLSFQNSFSQDSSYVLKTVVIDPGHGGKDPGCTHGKIYEKDIVLKVSKLLGGYIKENFPEVKVVYTRETDKYIELHKRSEKANKINADLFISIHVNAINNSKPYGTETFVMGLHKSQGNLEVAKTENSVILLEDNYEKHYEGYNPNDPESDIIFSLFANVNQEQSLIFASKIQTQFRERVKRKDRGVKQAGLVVLWRSAMPSVLVELGFLSNPKERAYLTSKQGQVYLASAIYRAFKEYKKEIESKSNMSYYIDEEKGKAPEVIVEEGIYFKLQILTSTKKIDKSDKVFADLDDLFILEERGKYKYYTGKSKNYKDISKLKRKLKKKFPDSFMIAFKNGKKIPLKDAIKEIKE